VDRRGDQAARLRGQADPRRRPFRTARALGLAVLFSTATSQPPPVARKTVFSALKVGQSVAVKDKGALYEISTTDDDGPQTHKVVEVGDDYIVLRDAAEVTTSRIPVTAVRAVVAIKTKK